MISQRALLCLSVLMMAPITASSQTSFYAEIESQDAVSPWKLQSSVSGYFGTGYFYWSGGDRYGGDKKGIVTYSFSVGESGTYIVDFHGRRNHSGECDGAANDLCNDIFVKVDDGHWEKHMIKRMGWDKWGWDKNYDKHGSGVVTHKVSLDAGSHTVRIAGRSRGVLLDAVRVYKEGSTPPTSPGGGGGGGGGDPTSIVEPAAGTLLVMGSTITLRGEGTNLSWEYDANSDKKSRIAIGSGAEVSFTVPTDVVSPLEITIFCKGDGGEVSRLYQLSDETSILTGRRGAGRATNRPAAYFALDGTRIDAEDIRNNPHTVHGVYIEVRGAKARVLTAGHR